LNRWRFSTLSAGSIICVKKLNLKSAICIPLAPSTAAGQPVRPLGALYIDSSSMVHPLLEEQVEIMKALANHVAISIDNARLFEEVEDKSKQISLLNQELEQRVEVQAGSLAEMRGLLAETQRDLGRAFGLERIVGKSKPMRDVFRILEKVERTHATVLITGESGTGKELVAKHLHYHGPRCEGPMISINCSALNDTLLESELFGHRKGAFTGAVENKMGLFQLADNGTLFLDEVGDMSEEMQKRLLRVLQDGAIRPVGSKDTFHVDVWVIAATHRNLEERVRAGKVREDLYFRLNVIRIALAPLRERRDDIPLLIEFLSRKIAEEMGLPLLHVSADILQKFMKYDWPGNVRQLENELRRAFILESDYNPELLQDTLETSEDLKMTSMERKAIVRALQASGGNKTRAAETLGMSRSAFYDKLSKYNIP